MPRALQLFLNGCQLGSGTTVIMEDPRPKPGIFVFPCRLYLLGYLSLSLA
jgi:hypothetical protein